MDSESSQQNQICSPLTPLSSTSISLILELIVPPSLLDPLPPHLLSSSLRQRHHFLHISPDNPLDYLAWPTDSPSQNKAIDLLESLPKPIEQHVYHVRYSTDSESTFAHVTIPSNNPLGFRLIFQWDHPDGWKYHNLALMPFPRDTFDSLEDVVTYQPHDFLEERSAMTASIDDDASYWDAYGHYDEPEDRSTFDAIKGSHTNAEDAYWAQYSVVHGSSDSTVPTPPRMNLKKEFSERIVLPYPGLHPSAVYNPLEPPSPNALTRRLADISPRPESPTLVDNPDVTPPSDYALSTPSPQSCSTPESQRDGANVKLFTLSELMEQMTHNPLATLTDFLNSVTRRCCDTCATMLRSSSAQFFPVPVEPIVIPDIKNSIGHSVDNTDEPREALRDAVRSLYRLWRSGKRTESDVHNRNGDEFLDIVRQVVAESSPKMIGW